MSTLNGNTYNNTPSNTVDETTGANATRGPNVGARVRGVAEFIHGIGENIRGTALGAVDTMVKKGPTANDEVARQGRLEMERGLANIKGKNHVQPPAPTQTSTTGGLTNSPMHATQPDISNQNTVPDATGSKYGAHHVADTTPYTNATANGAGV